MLGTPIQIENHTVRVSDVGGMTVVTIRNKFNFGMQWCSLGLPSKRVLVELVDIHRRTFAGNERIN